MLTIPTVDFLRHLLDHRNIHAQCVTKLEQQIKYPNQKGCSSTVRIEVETCDQILRSNFWDLIVRTGEQNCLTLLSSAYSTLLYA